MEWLVWSIAGAVICGAIAAAKKRNVFDWIVLGALFCVVSIIILLCLPKLDDVNKPRRESHLDRSNQTISFTSQQNYNNISQGPQALYDGEDKDNYDSVQVNSNKLLFLPEWELNRYVDDLLIRIKYKEKELKDTSLPPFDFTLSFSSFEKALMECNQMEAEQNAIDHIALQTRYYDSDHYNMHKCENMERIGSRFLSELRHPLALKWLLAAYKLREQPDLTKNSMPLTYKCRWYLINYLLHSDLWKVYFELNNFPDKAYRFPYTESDMMRFRKTAKPKISYYEYISKRYGKLWDKCSPKCADDYNKCSWGFINNR